ncbi:PREDICTED: balbiani ring protein 3-like [Amphimedon queenslandica]|uniref:Uncharacterized protein n=1 Tax=Amphimedon queenslandica TaxID=400682 RepID=A0A1X7VUW9_AMPQE|nr:PREDICTED: balbiani ring protein 3-like [Amphimedon queenslandica]|eukprot:XP_019849422.1 PREDICTED: balbiani ring protein 3-like [Amphimedon queenslandica]
MMKCFSCIICLLAITLVVDGIKYRHNYQQPKKGNVLPVPFPLVPAQGPLPLRGPLPGPLPGPRPFPGPFPGPACRRIIQCLPGQVFDERVCRCVCPVRIQQCPGGSTFDQGTCKCRCNAVCNQFQVLNEAACRCDPHNNPPASNCPGLRCFVNQVPNFQTCQCQCRNLVQCRFPQIFNPSTCQCQCPANRACTNLQFVDPNTCQCTCRQDIACPRGQVRDPFSCRCECDRRSCRFPQVLNPDTCQCECSRRFCPSPRFLNPATCQCECSNGQSSCNPQNQRFNPDTCQCECTRVSVTVEVTEPGIPIPGPPAVGPQPPIFIGGGSRTPGGRLRPGTNRFIFGGNGFNGFNTGFNTGFPQAFGNGFQFLGRRKRAALVNERNRRRTSRSPGGGGFIFLPPAPTGPPATSPPSTRTEIRFVSPPCPAGTFLNSATCSCN